jgi:hypothetical protein
MMHFSAKCGSSWVMVLQNPTMPCGSFPVGGVMTIPKKARSVMCTFTYRYYYLFIYLVS